MPHHGRVAVPQLDGPAIRGDRGLELLPLPRLVGPGLGELLAHPAAAMDQRDPGPVRAPRPSARSGGRGPRPAPRLLRRVGRRSAPARSGTGPGRTGRSCSSSSSTVWICASACLASPAWSARSKSWRRGSRLSGSSLASRDQAPGGARQVLLRRPARRPAPVSSRGGRPARRPPGPGQLVEGRDDLRPAPAGGAACGPAAGRPGRRVPAGPGPATPALVVSAGRISPADQHLGLGDPGLGSLGNCARGRDLVAGRLRPAPGPWPGPAACRTRNSSGPVRSGAAAAAWAISFSASVPLALRLGQPAILLDQEVRPAAGRTWARPCKRPDIPGSPRRWWPRLRSAPGSTPAAAAAPSGWCCRPRSIASRRRLAHADPA